MQLELLEEYKLMKEMIHELKSNHGCIGMKMSTEDQGNSIDFIDFINNRLLNGVLPFNIKIGGPDAKNDIKECLKIGTSGIIAPMVESPFGVKKFITALRRIAGEEVMKRLLVSVNLESITAYEKIEEILKAPDIKDINQIVIGTGDLAFSVGKPVADSKVVDMVRDMTLKSKNAGKIVRIGGMMSIARDDPDNLKSLLDETNADKVNSGNICFDVEKVHDLKSAYMNAIKFEIAMNNFWLTLWNKRIAPFNERVSSLKKRLL